MGRLQKGKITKQNKNVRGANRTRSASGGRKLSRSRDGSRKSLEKKDSPRQSERRNGRRVLRDRTNSNSTEKSTAKKPSTKKPKTRSGVLSTPEKRDSPQTSPFSSGVIRSPRTKRHSQSFSVKKLDLNASKAARRRSSLEKVDEIAENQNDADKRQNFVPVYRKFPLVDNGSNSGIGLAVYEFEVDPSEEQLPKKKKVKKANPRPRRKHARQPDLEDESDPVKTVVRKLRRLRTSSPATKKGVAPSVLVVETTQNSIEDSEKARIVPGINDEVSQMNNVNSEEPSLPPAAILKENSASVTVDNDLQRMDISCSESKQVTARTNQTTLLRFFNVEPRKSSLVAPSSLNSGTACDVLREIDNTGTSGRQSSILSRQSLISEKGLSHVLACSTPSGNDNFLLSMKTAVKNHSTPHESANHSSKTDELTVDNCFGFTDDEEENNKLSISPVKSSGFNVKVFFDSLPRNKKEEQMAAPSRFSIGQMKALAKMKLKKTASTTTTIPKSQNSTAVVGPSRQERTTTVASVIHHSPVSPPVSFTKPPRRSYDKKMLQAVKRKMIEFEDSETTVDKKDLSKKKNVDKRKQRKETGELEKWASTFNSELAEVESFELCVE